MTMRVHIPIDGNVPDAAENVLLYADNELSSVGTLRSRGFASVTLRFVNNQPFTLNTYARLYHEDTWVLYDSVAVVARTASVKNIFTFNLSNLPQVKFEALCGATTQGVWLPIMEASPHGEACGAC